MWLKVLLVAHIAVLGYWLGAELVINSTYRYVARSAGMPFAERGRLMQHVMHADQHVRYALVLQAGLGFALAAAYGYVPGAPGTTWLALALCALWLGFVELVHRLHHRPVGARLARLDRTSRWLLMALLVALAFGLAGGTWPMPGWLRAKLALFAAVMGCGVGIRLALVRHFRTWAEMAAGADHAEGNAAIRRISRQATGILVVLWACIAAIAVLAVWKPA